jgi:hypothetical protein
MYCTSKINVTAVSYLVVKWRKKDKKTSIPLHEMTLQLVLPNWEEHKKLKIQKMELVQGSTIKKPSYEAFSLAIFSALAMTSSMPPTM